MLHGEGFDLAAMFNWSYGNKVYNANKIMASTHTNRKYNNIRDFMSLETVGRLLIRKRVPM